MGEGRTSRTGRPSIWCVYIVRQAVVNTRRKTLMASLFTFREHIVKHDKVTEALIDIFTWAQTTGKQYVLSVAGRTPQGRPGSF